MSAPKKVEIYNQKGAINIVEDGKKYPSGEEANAVIFSKEDLTISGSGKLYIIGNYAKGINCKDDLEVKNTSIYINSKDDALRGKDSLTIENAYLYVEAGADGLRTTNNTTEGKGTLSASCSELYLTTRQDGIQAATDLRVEKCSGVICAGEEMEGKENKKSAKGIKGENQVVILGGNICVVRSYEGIEGENVIIQGANLDITSSDDGINTSTNQESVTPKIEMEEGNIQINASGDGVDSNGDIEIKSGVLTIYGPTNDDNGALDYDGTMKTGAEATVLAVGSSGMAQGISEAESGSLEFTCDVDSEETLSIQNSDGNVVLSVDAPKGYKCVIYTSPEIKKDGSYSVYIGGTSLGNLSAK